MLKLRKIWAALGTSIAVALLVILAVEGHRLSTIDEPISHNQSHNQIEAQLAPAATLELADLASYAELPVGSVESHEVADARGTVVLIPQYHLNPASAPASGMNDSAQEAQEQIYDILRALITKSDIGFIMIEGELYGEVSEDKIAKLAQRMAQRDILASAYRNLREGLSTQSLDLVLEESIFAQLDQELTRIDRTIILQGAPFKLAAEEGSRVKLWGLENEATREESKRIVRDYVYVQDQLSATSGIGLTRRPVWSSHLFEPGSDTLQALLTVFSQQPPVSFELTQLESLARSYGNEEIATASLGVKAALEPLQQSRPSQTVLAKSTPSRQSNPYRSIRSGQQLKKILAKVESKIEEVVVNRRNQEAAEYVREALVANAETTGVVQFGAGHTTGLVRELNQQGLTVIVVTPTEVLNRSLAPAP